MEFAVTASHAKAIALKLNTRPLALSFGGHLHIVLELEVAKQLDSQL